MRPLTGGRRHRLWITGCAGGIVRIAHPPTQSHSQERNMPVKNIISTVALSAVIIMAATGCRSSKKAPPALSSAGQPSQRHVHSAPPTSRQPYGRSAYPTSTHRAAPYNSAERTAPSSGPVAYGATVSRYAEPSNQDDSFAPTYPPPNSGSESGSRGSRLSSSSSSCSSGCSH